MPLLGQSGRGLDAHIASLSASIALVQFPILALLDFYAAAAIFEKVLSPMVLVDPY